LTTRSQGFGLRVREGGSRLWIYQHSRDGHTKRMTLGSMSKIGAAKAKALWKLAIFRVPFFDLDQIRRSRAQTILNGVRSRAMGIVD